jgi:hypothetical protein
MDVVEKDFGVKAFSMFLKAFHQFRALHAHCIGWPIIDVGSGHELATLGHAGDEHGVEVSARSVNRRAIAGRTGTEDEKAGVLASHILYMRIIIKKNRFNC